MQPTEQLGTNAAPPARRARRTLSRTERFWIATAIVLVALVGLYAGASAYTRRSAFCNSCHEMTPYYAAWRQGPHAETKCVSCHVEPGVIADFTHKFVALKEVWIHFTGEPTFPKATAEVPDSRCLRCHDDPIDPGIAEFDHEKHRGGRACQTCHYDDGHLVTAASLEAAGILNADVQASINARRGVVNVGGASLAGHRQVVCSQCHNMPASTCEACHDRPAGHATRPCMTCHVAATWTFTHPTATATCVLCHGRPEDHPDGACPQCHTTAASWAFVHPTSTACDACHTPPPNHYAGSCAACHTPTTLFAQTVFKHPGVGAACTDCHARPAGHSARQCSTCHRPATSWAFAHPSSRSCANCHRAPRGHYGTSCASCHSASRAWSSATFSHPAIPGGEHSYRSFACAKCHPRGYGTYTCTACHDGNGGEEGDD